jgi:hypothetical protein
MASVYGSSKPKRPDADLFSEQHIGQAWSYATHPRIDVPFMVLANGTRFGVFDLGEDEWDTPILHIQQDELAARFASLEAVLGARQIASAARRRQLRHLRRALAAQLDDQALDQTLRDVQTIVDDLRPEIRRKQAAVTSEAWAEQFERWEAGDRQAGVWGIAFAANGVRGPVGAEILTCAELIREREPEHRADAFDEMLAVARVGDTARQTWSLQVLRLSVALRCVGVDGCDSIARETALGLVRDAAERYPGDPVAAAAYELWRVLPAFLARLVLVYQADSATEQVERARATFDVERFLRDQVLAGLNEEAMLGQTIDLLFRQVWTGFAPWTVEALQAAAQTCWELLTTMPQSGRVTIGQVNNANFETPLESDPLVPITRNVLLQVADPSSRTARDPISPSQVAFADELIGRFFGEESGDS